MSGCRRWLVLIFVLSLAFAVLPTVRAQNQSGIQSVQPTTNGGIALTWSTSPGRSNQVMYTDSLGESWQDLPGARFLAGTNQFTLSYTDYPAADVTQRFYRIKNGMAPLVALNRSIHSTARTKCGHQYGRA